jgi:hypothetical protein
MNVNPKPPWSFGAIYNRLNNPFAEPGYLRLEVLLNETKRVMLYDPSIGAGRPEAFVLQDLFKITEPGKYRLAFEIRALRRRSSMFQNFEPCYLPVNVEIEIKKP